MTDTATEQPIHTLEPIVVYGDGSITQPPTNTQETPLAPVLFDKGYGALNAAYTQAIVNLVDDLPKYSYERVFVTVKLGERKP